MDRLLKNSPSTLTLTWTDEAGNLLEAGAVTVTVRDGAGVTVATGAAANDANTTGIYTFALTPANTAILDNYEVTWASGANGSRLTFFEVVNGFYFSVMEARKFRYGSQTLNDEAKYPTQDIVDAREEAEQDLEDACGVAFVRRSRRVTLDGSDLEYLWLPNAQVRRVISVTVDGVAYTQAELDELKIYTDESRLVRPDSYFLSGTNNVTIHYEHGLDIPPASVKRAALLLTLDRLIPSDVLGLRTLSVTDEYGSKQLSVPGKGRRFGIPEVDELVNTMRAKYRVPVAR